MSENPSRAQPPVVDRATLEQQLEGLRAREKATPAKATRSPPRVAGCRW